MWFPTYPTLFPVIRLTPWSSSCPSAAFIFHCSGRISKPNPCRKSCPCFQSCSIGRFCGVHSPVHSDCLLALKQHPSEMAAIIEDDTLYLLICGLLYSIKFFYGIGDYHGFQTAASNIWKLWKLIKLTANLALNVRKGKKQKINWCCCSEGNPASSAFKWSNRSLGFLFLFSKSEFPNFTWML